MARRRPSVAPAAALPAAALGGAVLAGSLLAFQARANGSLAARLGSPVVAALVTYGVASATLLAVVVAAGQLPSLRLARSAGWYWWLGGLAGAAVVVTTAASVPLLGVALVSVCLVAGATSGGLVADWAGLGPDGPRRPSARRLAGAVLAVGGVGVGLLGQRGQHGHPLLVLLVLAVGFCSAGQQAASGHLAAATGDARSAALVASVVAAAALAATVALLAALGRLPQVRWSAPAWTYLGGLAVAAYGTVAAAVVRRLGVLLLTLTTVSGQLLGSVVLDALAPAPGGLRAATVAAALVTLAAVAVAAGRPGARLAARSQRSLRGVSRHGPGRARRSGILSRMQPLRAVLFDVGDTLFERQGGSRAVVDTAASLGVRVEEAVAERLWTEVQARARTPEELAKGRDLSPAAHRSAWTALYRPADALAQGLAEALYEREIGPDHWAPFPDTVPILRTLAARRVPVGVVSDVGFDLRPFFERHGGLDLIGSFVLSCEHGAAKPARVLFETACAELGVAPEATVMVGDNPLTDGGAVDAGLVCLLLPKVPPGHPRGLGRVLVLLD